MNSGERTVAGDHGELATVGFAREVFGPRRFLDASMAVSVLGDAKLPDEQVLPFTQSGLEHSASIGDILFFTPPDRTMWDICDLRGNKTSRGEPLVFEPDKRVGEHYFGNDHLCGNWWLVSEIVPKSDGQDYLGQTSVLAAHLPIIFGNERPSHMVEALRQFEEGKRDIEMGRMTKPAAMFERLIGLDINTLFRPPPVLLFWLLVFCEATKIEVQPLAHAGIWTNRCARVGRKPRDMSWPVGIGGFGPSGIKMAPIDPWMGMPHLGVCCARRGKLLDGLAC